MLNFVIGYFIVINIIPMIIIYADITVNFKMSNQMLNFLYVVLTLIGGGIGIIMASQMFGYRRDEKAMTRTIPIIVILQIIIIFCVLAYRNNWQLINFRDFFITK